MIRGHRFLLLAAPLLIASPALACEPVVPFMQVMVTALALTGSIFVLAAAVNSTPNPVVTSSALAGFAVAFAFPFEGRFSGLGLTVLAGFAASDPVVTSVSLAGFAGARRPHAPGGRTPIPAAFR